MDKGQEQTQIMIDLKTNWDILKDETKSVMIRKKACELIVSLSDKASCLDKTFKVLDLSGTKYADFLPRDFKSNVNWGEEVSMEIKEKYKMEISVLNELEKIAVSMTRKRLPNESQDSQKFGMITSAYTDKLIRLHKATLI